MFFDSNDPGAPVLVFLVLPEGLDGAPEYADVAWLHLARSPHPTETNICYCTRSKATKLN